MKLPTGSRWPMLALILSLGGNAFLGGYLFGRDASTAAVPFGFPGGPPPGPPPGPAFFVELLAQKLPAADAATLRAAVSDNRDFLDAEDARRRAFPRLVRGVLTVEPFDPAALERVLREHDEAEYQAHHRLRAAVVKAAAALSPEARRILAESGPPHPPPPPRPR